MYSLQTEVQLDILKCLNFNQLFSFKQTNLHFLNLINKYENELARIKFDELKIWKTAIAESISLFSKYFVSCKNFIGLFFHDKKFRHCFLDLPNFPKNIEEMIILRYWLERLFNCAFEYAYFNKIVFNPKIIELLFDNDYTIPLQFHIQKFYLLVQNNICDDISKFVLNHLTISESLTINFKQADIKEKNINILFKILTNGRQRLPKVCLNSVDLARLYELIIQHITTSKDFSKMVPVIILNYILLSNFELNEKAENVESEQFAFGKSIKYQIVNTYNPKMRFSFCNEEWMSGQTHRIHVKIMKAEPL
ncbi:unnamed protein product [Meloidogyne enterolobii]|uniref:Uncharacterized protein n=2 Tax=Meloidogyne enterolobii TaxID=390850 RepID=A0ACB0YXY5_MELEN